MIKRSNAFTALVALGATSFSTFVQAHPGHEPDDFVHAIAHELASPRGILAIIVLVVAVSYWVYGRSDKK
jgi:hypothetical protein